MLRDETRHEPLAKASVAPADANAVLQQELPHRECRETCGPAAWGGTPLTTWSKRRICQVTWLNKLLTKPTLAQHTSPSLMPRNRPAGATTSGASLLAATKLPRDNNHRSAMTSLELAAFGFKSSKCQGVPRKYQNSSEIF